MGIVNFNGPGGGGGLPSDWTEEVTATALENITKGDAIEYRAFPGSDVFNGAALAMPEIIYRLAYSRDGNTRAYVPEVNDRVIVIQRKVDGAFVSVYTQTFDAGGLRTVTVSADGTYVFVANYSSDANGMIRAYKYDGVSTYTVADSYLLTYIKSMKVSLDDTYILVGRKDGYLRALKFADDDITSLGDVANSVYSTAVYTIDCSNDGVYWVYCGYFNLFDGYCYAIVKRTGDSFTAVNTNFYETTASYAGACAISPDGTKIVVSKSGSFLGLYDYTGEVLTSISLPLALSGQVHEILEGTSPIAFTYDGEYLIVGHEVAPFVTVLKVNAAVPFTKIANPAYLPTNYALCVARNGNNAIVVLQSNYTCVEYITGVSDCLMPLHSLRDTRYFSLDQYGYYGVGMAKTSAAAGDQCTATLFKKINDAGAGV